MINKLLAIFNETYTVKLGYNGLGYEQQKFFIPNCSLYSSLTVIRGIKLDWSENLKR